MDKANCLARRCQSAVLTSRQAVILQESWLLLLAATPLLFQRKAMDPSRFTNRGGNLLKEEKMRAKIQKTLQKVCEREAD